MSRQARDTYRLHDRLRRLIRRCTERPRDYPALIQTVVMTELSLCERGEPFPDALGQIARLAAPPHVIQDDEDLDAAMLVSRISQRNPAHCRRANAVVRSLSLSSLVFSWDLARESETWQVLVAWGEIPAGMTVSWEVAREMGHGDHLAIEMDIVRRRVGR